MLRLKELQLTNFKGIRDLTITPDGKNASILGDNATGKTTVYDAFVWVLFDKDSLGQKDFDIKTLDEKGQPISGVEHGATVVLSDGHDDISFRKVYYEKWVKQRGAADRVFSGHTVDYYVNDVPVKKTEYTAKIEGLGVTENVFKLLTNPIHFNERLHWQERRKILIEVCGDVSDQDVIATKESLKRLPEILGNKTIEDYRKIIAARKKEVNEKLERIPVRIDEVIKSKPEIEGINFNAIEFKIQELNVLKEEKQLLIVRIETGGEIAKKEKYLAELQADIIKITSEHQSKTFGLVNELQIVLNKKQAEAGNIQHDINNLTHTLDTLTRVIEFGTKKRETLRTAYELAYSQKFTYESECVCPTCKQALPADQIDTARFKATEAFNLEKAKTLEKIQSDGKSLAAEINASVEKSVELTSEIERLMNCKDACNVYIGNIQDNIEAAHAEVSNVEDNKDYQFTEGIIGTVIKEIDILKSVNQDAVSLLKKQFGEITTEVQALLSQLALKKQSEKVDERVVELKEEERSLANEFEKLEQHLFLTEDFIKTKVELLEERINSKFESVKFKMFDQQINGGLQECCEVMFNGVPYSSLNNAARINIGLDIINTLSDHYKFDAPIFVDNREAVTNLKQVRSQVISLIVSEADKKLRVEVA